MNTSTCAPQQNPRQYSRQCSRGSQAFVDSLGEWKETYTIRECVELTKGRYNAERFEEFFREEM